MKIILVDDKPHVRDSLRLALEKLPFKYEEILEASCDPAAIQLIQKHEPDIIVTDAKLLSEADLLDQLDSLKPHGRIIVTSSHDFILDAFSKGGIEVLLKPIGMKELEFALLSVSAAAGQGGLYKEQKGIATG